MQYKSINNLLLTVGILIAGCTILPFNEAESSTKTYEGYVVKESGDTIYGKLQMLSPTMNQVKVKLTDENGQRMTLKAKTIKSYAFKVDIWNRKEKLNIPKWIFYIKKTVDRPPVPFAGNDILMQQEINGTISLYNYYIETRSNQETAHIIFIEKADKMYEIERDNYKNVLKDLMNDNPAIRQKIGTKGYTYKYLTKTITEYNTTKDNDTTVTTKNNP